MAIHQRQACTVGVESVGVGSDISQGEAMINDADKQKIAAAFARQWRQAKGEQPVVQCCECKVCAPIRFLYRCLYCGLWRCQSCSERHFGKTREQYLQEQ